MKKNFFSIVFILMFSVVSAQAKLFKISEYELENGLKLLVVPNHKAPIAKHMVWYKIGSIDEKSGKSGSAHLLEHMMFRGTKNISGAEFNNIMQKNGISSNAFTSTDFTAYHQELDISRLELAMALEADRMQNLDFSDEDFLTERKVVFQERKQVVDSDPQSSFYETMQRYLWQLHPYAKPVSGTEEEILSLTKADIMDLYNRYYSPQNATVVISGDISPEVALSLTKKYYGKVKARPIDKRKKFATLNSTSKATLQMKLPHISAPRIIIRYATDAYNTNPQEMYALEVLSKYLGEGMTSQLYKNLVLKDKKAIIVSSNYDGFSRSYGRFNISAVPVTSLSLEEFEPLLKKAVKQAVAKIDEEKIKIAKQQMLAGLVYLKDNPFDAAYLVGVLHTIGMSKDGIENYADNVRKITAEDVKRAADKLFNNTPFVEGYLKTSPKEENTQSAIKEVKQ